VHSWRDSLSGQILSQQPDGAKNAHLYGGNRDTESLGNFLVRLFFDERENCRDAKAGREPTKCLRGLDADLGGDAGIGFGWCGNVCDVVTGWFRVGATGAKPVERRVGGDAASPGLESARRVEASVGAMNTPKSFDSEVFGCRRIANDFEDPPIHSSLVLAKERFEGVKIALPKSVK
jgi:hypothetical protein